tara:strand:- start:323 stop:904 length:582 start_codon:yes stop_codon:yes gene_type:complete
MLMPEENTTIEGGAEFSMGGNFRVSAVYFNRTEDNFVDFVTVDPELFLFQYQNSSEQFESSGVEVEFFGKILDQLTASANYTNTQVDERLALRIPEHKANMNLRYVWKKRTTIGLSYQYVGEREDTFFNPLTFENETIGLESFGLLNFNMSGQLTKNIRIFAGVTNIFDTEYEEIYRFQTRGRNLLVGFELTF